MVLGADFQTSVDSQQVVLHGNFRKKGGPIIVP